MKITVVAEGEEVEFEALALHHALARDVTDVDVPEIGLTGFGAQGGELGTVEGHEILVFGMFVREGLQHIGVVVVRIPDVLISQQGDALQFVFCSHVSFQFFCTREEKP